jgi:hypothetical protein
MRSRTKHCSRRIAVEISTPLICDSRTSNGKSWEIFWDAFAALVRSAGVAANNPEAAAVT